MRQAASAYGGFYSARITDAPLSLVPGKQARFQKLKAASADYVVLEADLEKPETIRNIAPNGVNTVLKIIGLYSLENISMPALAIYGTYVMMGILDKVWSIQDFGARFVPSCHKLTTLTTLEKDYECALELLAETGENSDRCL